MNLFSGFLFFYVLILLLIPAAVLGLMGKKLKWYGFAVTLAFTVMVFSTPGKAAFIIGFYILQLLLVMSFLAIRNKVSEKWLPYLLALYVVLSVSPIVLAKLNGLLGLHLEFLGVSYMTFRAVQLLIEIRDGFTTNVKILDFTYFLLFFPRFLPAPWIVTAVSWATSTVCRPRKNTGRACRPACVGCLPVRCTIL